MSVDWDCWIGDEDGANQIHFVDEEQPNPIPLPEAAWQGTIHDLVAPGAQALQSAGYSGETLTINLRIPYDKWLLLKALLTRRDEDGTHLQVQFFNSYETYLCTSIGNLKPELANRLPARVVVTLQLLIESEVA